MLADKPGFKISSIDSQVDGPTVCISGIVHGDEQCGMKTIELLQNIMPKKLIRGRLLLCLANIFAAQKKQRFIDSDLNRCFGENSTKGHEHDIASRIKEHLKNADYLLDLHSTSSPTKPFCAGKNTQRHVSSFKLTQLETYMWGWGEHRGFNMMVDEVDRQGGIGIVAECGQTGKKETDDTALLVALNFLSGLKMTNEKQIEKGRNKKEIIQIKDIVKAKTNRFRFTKSFKNLDKVNAEEVIAYDDNTPIYHMEEILIAMPTLSSIKKGDEAYGVGIVKDFFN